MKLKRESWQTWSNYAHAAVQTRNFLPAARGILQVTNPPGPPLQQQRHVRRHESMHPRHTAETG